MAKPENNLPSIEEFMEGRVVVLQNSDATQHNIRPSIPFRVNWRKRRRSTSLPISSRSLGSAPKKYPSIRRQQRL
jgi:homoserine trans-succinylase